MVFAGIPVARASWLTVNGRSMAVPPCAMCLERKVHVPLAGRSRGITGQTKKFFLRVSSAQLVEHSQDCRDATNGFSTASLPPSAARTLPQRLLHRRVSPSGAVSSTAPAPERYRQSRHAPHL